MSSKLTYGKEQIKWRRAKVLELDSQGHNQSDIAKILHIGYGTVSSDLSFLRKQAQENLQKHIQDKIPEEYQRCITGMNQVLKLSWDIANKSKDGNGNDNGQTMTMTDDKTRLQALSLINDCYKYIMDLTTNGVVITDAIKFVQAQMNHLNNQEKELLDDQSIKEKEKEPPNDSVQEDIKTTNGVF